MIMIMTMIIVKMLDSARNSKYTPRSGQFVLIWDVGVPVDLINRCCTGKCIRRFAGIYAYCRYFIDRKW